MVNRFLKIIPLSAMLFLNDKNSSINIIILCRRVHVF